jgi:hypothetical protein
MDVKYVRFLPRISRFTRRLRTKSPPGLMADTVYGFVAIR